MNKSFLLAYNVWTASHFNRAANRNMKDGERFLLSQCKVRMISFNTRFRSHWTNKFEISLWLQFHCKTHVPFACLTNYFTVFFSQRFLPSGWKICMWWQLKRRDFFFFVGWCFVWENIPLLNMECTYTLEWHSTAKWVRNCQR